MRGWFRALRALRDYARRIDSPWVFPNGTADSSATPSTPARRSSSATQHEQASGPSGGTRYATPSPATSPGVSLKAIHALMGHATTEMTIRYAT
jgi:hypothetical protein